MVESLPLNLAGLDDEDLTQETLDQAESLLKQESLLNQVSQIGATAAAIVPASLDALDDRMAHEGSENENGYVETPMNSDGFFADSGDQACSVKVAVRVRPLIGREYRDGNRRTCVESTPEEHKLQIGTAEFSYDRVFDQESDQADIYEVCSKNLILGCFAGYNATILAYGQTGSGKTHTMGTGSTVGLPFEQIGIVPRVFDFIFEEIANRRRQSELSEFSVKVQFLELYGNDLRDLLDNSPVDKATGQSAKVLKITEGKNGSISVAGLKAELVESKTECIQILNKGIASRMTAQTMMNEASSRSHAIFTVTIDQKIVKVTAQADGAAADPPEDAAAGSAEENITAKFHFVDLAGSERIKKTGATGKTLQEGIQINQGLLALGNVIAALTETKKAGRPFIPYRNSNLTRILQDSLGGNSRTTMIACVSPAESNYEETLSTIKYASRARNIKNKPVVNRDANSMLIEALRNQITSLQAESAEYQGLLRANNIPIPEGLQEAAEQKAQEVAMNRRSSVLSVAGANALGLGRQETRDTGSVSSGELRDLKLKLARAERENKELKEQLEQIKKTGRAEATSFDEIQNERDQLAMKNEALSELLTKNNIAQPSSIVQGPTTGGKRTQTLIDEYKAKTAKAREESEKKTAEILAKSKKIAELSSAQKRDEALLKKAIADVNKYKKLVESQKPKDRLIVQPVAMPGAKAKGAPLAGQQQVPDAEEIKNQFMDRLTSQLENFFAVPEAGEGEAEGAQSAAASSQLQAIPEATSLLPAEQQIDTSATGVEAAGDQAEPVMQVSEGDQALAERSIAEASRATSLEEKEKLLSAVKQNVDQIKSDLGELLKNTWAQRIQEIQAQMGRIEQDKRRNLAGATADNAATKAIEKEYKQKMEVLQQQLTDQQRQKKKKEDNIQKTMAQQETRLKAMEMQLAQLKKQRDDAESAKKFGEERFSKFKSNVNKDLLTYKKSAKDKDQAVYKLKADLKKTDQLVSQKIQELKSLQKKAKEDAEKRRREEEKEQEKEGIDIDAIKDWIHQSTDQMLKQQELREYLQKQHTQRADIEDDMLKEGDRLTELIMQKERLEYEMESFAQAAENGEEVDEARHLEVEAELEEVCLESDSITATLDVLEEHLDHVETKIGQIGSEIKAFDLDAVSPPRFKGLNNVENARATLKTFFMVLLDLNVYKKDLENKLIEQDEAVLDLQSKVSILQETSSLSSAQQQVAFRKQAAMRQLVGQLGDGTEFMDNRMAEKMDLSANEQTQLTKMSLSKIVTNLRNKLKDEEKRNQSVSNKLDQIIKEKEQIKQKLQALQKELKTRGSSAGAPGSSFSSSYLPPATGPSGKPRGAVKSRINTGLSASPPGGEERKVEQFAGYASRSSVGRQRNGGDEPAKRMSFKQRRDQAKEQSAGKAHSLQQTQENVDGLVRKAAVTTSAKTRVGNNAGLTSLKESRDKAKAGVGGNDDGVRAAEIDELALEVQTLPGSRTITPKDVPDEKYLNADSQPATVMEEPDLEGSDVDDEPLIEETDEILDKNLAQKEARLKELDDEESKEPGSDLLQPATEDRFGSVSLISESILDSEKPEDYSWAFEAVVDLAGEAGQHIVDVDSLDDRCFILFSDLKLTEVNLQTKQVVQELNVATLDGAAEHMQSQRAIAFAMHKELNMITVSTQSSFHMFDCEKAEIEHFKALPLQNVQQICFVDQYFVVMTEDADNSEACLYCYQLEDEAPEGQIKIKEFLGQKVWIKSGDQSVCFSTGSQIGRIEVPSMELMFQEDAGHQITDFQTNDTCIFTTGTDQSLRLFDSDSGMMLIEPMADMEVDRLAIQGRHLVARCGGGQAMMVFKYTDGSEELEEEDFIECEALFGDPEDENSKFIMKGGLKVALSGTEYNMILTCYQNAEAKLSVKMLKNKSYGAV